MAALPAASRGRPQARRIAAKVPKATTVGTVSPNVTQFTFLVFLLPTNIQPYRGSFVEKRFKRDKWTQRRRVPVRQVEQGGPPQGGLKRLLLDLDVLSLGDMNHIERPSWLGGGAVAERRRLEVYADHMAPPRPKRKVDLAVM